MALGSITPFHHRQIEGRNLGGRVQPRRLLPMAFGFRIPPRIDAGHRNIVVQGRILLNTAHAAFGQTPEQLVGRLMLSQNTHGRRQLEYMLLVVGAGFAQ
ncbi:hypothetical protein D3C76_1148980 [compost metagenome]